MEMPKCTIMNIIVQEDLPGESLFGSEKLLGDSNVLNGKYCECGLGLHRD